MSQLKSSNQLGLEAGHLYMIFERISVYRHLEKKEPSNWNGPAVPGRQLQPGSIFMYLGECLNKTDYMGQGYEEEMCFYKIFYGESIMWLCHSVYEGGGLKPFIEDLQNMDSAKIEKQEQVRYYLETRKPT